jgi:membrane protease YdiL (CAAX protease family)
MRVLLLVLIALITPVMEEIAFRGLLQGAAVRRLGMVSGVVVTALVFALFHWAGFGETGTAIAFLTLGQLFFAGLVLGTVAARSGRLGPSIFVHAGFNAVTMFALYATSSLAG